MSISAASPLSPFMSPRERRNFKIDRLLRCADRRTTSETCMELECAETVRRKFGGTFLGTPLPPEIFWGTEEQLERYGSRTLVAGVPSAGGYATEPGEATPLLAYLHPRCRTLRLGAALAPLLPTGPEGTGGFRSALTLPVETGSDEAQWLAELETASEGNSTFGQAVAVSRRLFIMRKLSKQVLHQGNLNSVIEKTLMAGLGAALDRAALVGTGGKMPTGLLYNADVTTVALGTDGAAPTLAKLTEAVDGVIDSNSPMQAAGWMLSPNARSKTVCTPLFSNTSLPLTSTLNGVDQTVGFTSTASTFMPDTLEKGSSGAVCGSAIFGDWSQVAVVLWPTLAIQVDAVSGVRSGTVELWIETFADVITPRPECFRKITDMLTS